VVRVQGGNPCDIRLAVRPEFSDKYTKMVQKYSRFFTKNYAIGPSVPPKFVNFASLSQKEIGDQQNKKRDRHKHKKRSAANTNCVMAFVDCTNQQCAINIRHDTIRHQESESDE
jgi:hypothetical protein